MFCSLLLVLAAFAPSVYSLIHAVDSSTLVPQATFKKAYDEGFTKAIIRGYYEACGIGGAVDPNFVQSYKNARAAGYTNIDTYWFPCTGSRHNCKSPATQLAELGKVFKANNMKIGRIWVDIERDPIYCHPWDYGYSGNLAHAKAIVQALKASGYVYGIYSSPGEWSSIFGSYSVVVDNSVPLWFATYNNVQTVTLGTKFGGWTSAIGHQYTDKSASGKFDLSVFSN
ncbi:glycoside hydrolase superfamily [Cantharellus anzutake]|uniref:glycoside hydrolase superfamily n=1 Tax=Cantharellus anzutake TaxID=1750568 RepID=UPI001903A4A8|nr:glycoside hydrolase superfamily [Cantharellus anzutake]KAF8336953.1 glycoside hydrolase superfamily [Cantharellus anzutake]